MLSSLIILVSGHFVGWCSVCRATKSCSATVPARRWALWCAVAAARAGAGGRRVCSVRQPRRFGGHRRDRPDEGHRAAQGDEMMAVSPIACGRRAALLGRVIRCRCWRAVLGDGHLRRLADRWWFIGVDDGAFWSGCRPRSIPLRRDERRDQTALWCGGGADRGIRRLRLRATAEGVSRAITRTVVSSALAILALDFVMTSSCSGVCDGSYDDRSVGRVFVAIGLAALLFLALKVGKYFRPASGRLIPSGHFRQHRRFEVRGPR